MQGGMLWLTILFVGFQLRCAQADIQLVVKGSNFVDVNPEYIDPYYTGVSIIIDSNGRTMASSKIKIIKQFPEDVMYQFDIRAFFNGAYEQPVGIVLEGNLCEMIDDNIIVGQFFEMIGVPKENCPLSVGTYRNDYFYPRMDVLLDALPSGMYQLIFRLYHSDETILTIHGFIDLV